MNFFFSFFCYFWAGPGGGIRVYLEKLAEAENVQEFVRQHPFGQEAITETSEYWDFYLKVMDSISSKSITN